jgi:hypothetical protein
MPRRFSGAHSRQRRLNAGPCAETATLETSPPSYFVQEHEHGNPDSIPPRRPFGSDHPDDWVNRAVREAVQRGLVVLNPPTEMREGRTDRVEVGIARSVSLREALMTGLRGAGEPRFEEVGTSTLMGVELKGDSFEITPFSQPEQIVAPLAHWEFDVRPCRAGLQTLTLCVSQRVALPGLAEIGGGRRSVPVLERQIRVRANMSYNTRRFLADNWQWLIATAIAIGGGIGAWAAIFH